MGFLKVAKAPNGVLHFANIDFSSTDISFVGSFFLGCPNNFVDCRMERSEWMAWTCFAQQITPFIHNASITWVSLGLSTQTQILYIYDVCYGANEPSSEMPILNQGSLFSCQICFKRRQSDEGGFHYKRGEYCNLR